MELLQQPYNPTQDVATDPSLWGRACRMSAPYKRAFDKYIAEHGLDLTLQPILYWLCDYANDEGECWPGRTNLAKQCGASSKHIQRSTKALCRLGVLEMSDSACRSHAVHYRLLLTPVSKGRLTVPQSTSKRETHSPPIEQERGTVSPDAYIDGRADPGLDPEELKSRSDTECRTSEQSAPDSSAPHTRPGDCDIPPPETSDFFVPMDLEKDEEAANDPLSVHFEPDEPMAVPEPAAAPVAAAPCLHPDESVRMIWGKPGLSFYCRRCRKTIIDGKSQKPPPRRPRPIANTTMPAMKLGCYQPFATGPPEPSSEHFSPACPRHMHMQAVYDADSYVIGCKKCDWTPGAEPRRPAAWAGER